MNKYKQKLKYYAFFKDVPCFLKPIEISTEYLLLWPLCITCSNFRNDRHYNCTSLPERMTNL